MLQFLSREGITLVYGEAATGKTTLAMQASLEMVRKNKPVIFMDMEKGFSLERFKQLAGEDYKRYLDKIFLLHASTFQEQHKLIQKLQSTKQLGLVVVDTMGMHYRIAVREDYSLANNLLDKQLKILRQLPRLGILVLVTTQVYTSMENEIKNIGGNMVKNWCSSVVKLEKEPRRLIVEKPKNEEHFFTIINKGLLLS